MNGIGSIYCFWIKYYFTIPLYSLNKYEYSTQHWESRTSFGRSWLVHQPNLCGLLILLNLLSLVTIDHYWRSIVRNKDFSCLHMQWRKQSPIWGIRQHNLKITNHEDLILVRGDCCRHRLSFSLSTWRHRRWERWYWCKLTTWKSHHVQGSRPGAEQPVHVVGFGLQYQISAMFCEFICSFVVVLSICRFLSLINIKSI